MGGKGFRKPSHTSSVAVLSWPGGFPGVKPSSLHHPSVTSCSCIYLVASAWGRAWDPHFAGPHLQPGYGAVHPKDRGTTSSGTALPQGLSQVGSFPACSPQASRSHGLPRHCCSRLPFIPEVPPLCARSLQPAGAKALEISGTQKGLSPFLLTNPPAMTAPCAW